MQAVLSQAFHFKDKRFNAYLQLSRLQRQGRSRWQLLWHEEHHGRPYSRCKVHFDPAKQKKNNANNNANASAKKQDANIALGEAVILTWIRNKKKDTVASFSTIIDPLITNEYVAIHVCNVGGSVPHQHNEVFGYFSNRGHSESVLLLNGRNPKEEDFIKKIGKTCRTRPTMHRTAMM